MNETGEIPQEQLENSNVPPQLKKFVFKKGVSGNPGGRPKGAVSMKTYARQYLENMDEDARVEFLNNVDPRIVWEMSEGKAKQDLDIQGEMTTKVISVDE